MKHKYIEDYFSPTNRDTLLRCLPKTVFMLRWIVNAPVIAGHSVSFTKTDLVKEGIFNVMPRTIRTARQSATEKPRSMAPVSNKGTTWINVVLTPDDVHTLEGQTYSPEVVGSLLLSIADRGHSFSVKRMDDGASFMCAIFGQASGNDSGNYGVSAFAANPIDAVVACVYKFEERMGGVFDGWTDNAGTGKPRFR
jgi:hypothetical protein